MHNVRPALILTALSLIPSVKGQTPSASTKPLTFDAASVKPLDSPVAGVPDGSGKTIGRKQPGGGGNTEHSGRIHYQTSLHRMLMRAYNLGSYYQIQGPDSLSTQFVIDAIMPPETTKDQLRLMLQNLLVERFKIAVHREIRETPGHSLEVAKSGPKLKETTGDPLQPDAPPARGLDAFLATLGPDGFPKAAGWSPRTIEDGMSMYTSPIGWKVFFHAKTMHDLADYLWENSTLPSPSGSGEHSPVIDSTGLTSRYDFSLTYLPDDAPPPPHPDPIADRFRSAPNIPQALASQLGLNLVRRKVPVEMLVIDHIERMPTEN